MKKLVLATVLLITGIVRAQGPTYDDLRILYADGNYPKLVRAAEGYTLKDKSKADALPHMWMGRGLYKISLSGEAPEEYKNAYKDAVGAVGKAIKQDKSGEVQREYEEFFDEFRMSLVETISNELERGDFKKASSWVIKYYKLNPNSVGAKYLEAACKSRNADKGGANTMWKAADASLSQVTSLEGWTKADVELLKLGVIQSAEAYMATKQTEKARTLLGKVAQWYEDDADFRKKYDEIVN